MNAPTALHAAPLASPLPARASLRPVPPAAPPSPLSGPLRFAGYAALFDRADAGRDTIRRGAFARTIAEHERSGEPVPLLWQHRADLRIGWIERMAEDARGLQVIARLDNPDGVAALSLRRASVTGLSFGYRARSAKSGNAGRELLDLDLFEISLVTHPMQHGARVHMIS